MEEIKYIGTNKQEVIKFSKGRVIELKGYSHMFLKKRINVGDILIKKDDGDIIIK